MTVDLAYAKRQLRYWKNKVDQLRKSPAAPACKPKEENPSTGSIPAHPTLEEAIAHAKSVNPQLYPEALVREWYSLCEISGWRDVKNKPILNWGRNLHTWRKFYDFNKKESDPDRLPDARVRAATNPKRRKADNWHASPTYKVENVI